MSHPSNDASIEDAAHRTGRISSPLSSLGLAGTMVITCAVLIFFWPSLNGPFILDDGRYVANNPLIAAPDGLLRLWFTNESLEYYPVSNSTLWIEWHLWGNNPFGYRFTNLDLHIATSLLLWLILRKLSIPGAFFAALLFAVHPVNVEAVAWISQRKDVRALFFATLSILWFLQNDDESRATVSEQADTLAKPRLWYWASLLAFAMAMLSKGSVPSLPLVLLLILWWKHGLLTRHDVRKTLPFFGIAVLLGLVHAWYQLHGDPVAHASIPTRFAGAGGTIWFYLSKALLPVALLFPYPQWHIDTADLRWWLPLLAAIALSVTLIWQCRTHPSNWTRSVLFAWGFYCIALAPVMGFAEAGGMKVALVSDHYQHFAIIGVVALVAAGWNYFHQRALPERRWKFTALAIAVTGSLALLTWRHSWLFGHPVELYQTTLAANHDHYAGIFLHQNLGLQLADMGRLDEAIQHFQASLTLMPDNPFVRMRLGEALLQTNRPEEAIQQFQQALQAAPDSATTHNNLGIALRKTGRIQDAIEHYQQALELRSSFPEAHFNLANALVDTHRLGEAIQQFKAGLEIDPGNAEAHYLLGNALRAAGRSQEAVEQFLETLRLQPDHAAAQVAMAQLGPSTAAAQGSQGVAQAPTGSVAAEYNLAMAQLKAGAPQQAKEHFERALAIEPEFADAHQGLGTALVMLGRSTEALEHLQQVVRLKPNDADAHNNLATALANLGRLSEAVEHYQEAVRLKPAYLEAWTNLVLAYDHMHRTVEAVAAAQKALELARSQGQTALVEKIESWLATQHAPPPK